jgi:tRNA(Arg) A34 adenosine deaminase TadA
MDQTALDRYFMTAAIVEATVALNEKVFPVGSVIVRKEVIVATAH